MLLSHVTQMGKVPAHSVPIELSFLLSSQGKKKSFSQPVMAAHNCNPSTQQAKAGRSLQVGLHSEFNASLDHIETPCLNKTTKQNTFIQ